MGGLFEGAALGALFGLVLKLLVDVQNKTINFKSELERLVSILNALKPIIRDIEKFDGELDVLEEETKMFTDLLKKTAELVRKCSKITGLKCVMRAIYSKKLIKFVASLERFFQIYVQALQTRDNKKILVKVNELEKLYENILVKVYEIEKLDEKMNEIDAKWDEKMNEIDAQLDEKIMVKVNEIFLDENILVKVNEIVVKSVEKILVKMNESDEKILARVNEMIMAKVNEINAKSDEKILVKSDEKLLRYRNGGWVFDSNIPPANHLQFDTVEIKVKMDSDGCEREVKNSGKSMKGVKSVEVNQKQSWVTVSGYVDPNKVLKKVERTGKRSKKVPHNARSVSPDPYVHGQRFEAPNAAEGNIPDSCFVFFYYFLICFLVCFFFTHMSCWDLNTKRMDLNFTFFFGRKSTILEKYFDIWNPPN
ncbi:uncharacterized protein LOC132267463 [Cornus florida]|uniref:uncharacterized protein LOC132267463 n=1 Tax=Cornus florida TaxID=4283 RepID=UPI002897CD84|nr:uncharacterized protein LOC132267463 [Cornus florida]